jgi:hypothetical protein
MGERDKTLVSLQISRFLGIAGNVTGEFDNLGSCNSSCKSTCVTFIPFELAYERLLLYEF